MATSSFGRSKRMVLNLSSTSEHTLVSPWPHSRFLHSSQLFSLFFFFAGKIVDMSVSADGMLLCTTADDKSLKVFDVINFGECPQSLNNVVITLNLFRHDQHVSSQVCPLLLCVALCWRCCNTSSGLVSLLSISYMYIAGFYSKSMVTIQSHSWESKPTLHCSLYFGLCVYTCTCM